MDCAVRTLAARLNKKAQATGSSPLAGIPARSEKVDVRKEKLSLLVLACKFSEQSGGFEPGLVRQFLCVERMVAILVRRGCAAALVGNKPDPPLVGAVWLTLRKLNQNNFVSHPDWERLNGSYRKGLKRGNPNLLSVLHGGTLAKRYCYETQRYRISKFWKNSDSFDNRYGGWGAELKTRASGRTVVSFGTVVPCSVHKSCKFIPIFLKYGERK